MQKLIFGLDVDEVLAECIGYATDLWNKQYGTNISPFNITGWVDDKVPWTKYFSDPEFVRNQPVRQGAQQFVQELIKRGCDVVVITAVRPEVSTQRVEWIMENFPEIKPENIIIGKRKDLCAVDILLDDSPWNVLHSPAKYPILMRMPWNQNVTGLTAVNNFDDCLNLLDVIMRQNGFSVPSSKADMICLVAPSGSGKTEVIHALTDCGYSVPEIITTAKSATKPYYTHVDKPTFEANIKTFAETTSYAGEYYGITAAEIERCMNDSHSKLVIPIDVCGANVLMRMYGDRVKTVYLKRDRSELVSNILKKNIPDTEKALRILALDNEKRNEELCDYTVEYTTLDNVVAQIKTI